MAYIGLSIHNNAQIRTMWRASNPNIAVIQTECDDLSLHGTPEDIRRFAETILAALPPKDTECRNVLFPGDPSTCQDDPCACEFDESYEASDLLESAKALILAAECEGWDRARGTDEPRTGIAELRRAIAKAEARQ